MPDAKLEYRLGFRADVEGLRAVAILLVVAAHAKVGWLAGGFVGVDVFYVLSGYLITGLLVQEIRTTGELRFANFYGRRLRRLMPALLLMLVVVSVLGRLLLPISGMPAQASAAAAAAVWVSNFHFALSDMGYFSPGPESNLFLHTWSLGVEEQFYLVWPLLVVLAMGAWEGAKRPASARNLKWLFGGIFTVSFALSLYWTFHASHLAFYMMPARAWQFALGALVFLLVGSPSYPHKLTESTTRWLPMAGWIGLAMILLAAILFNGSMPYPGARALLPTAGAALVLAAGGQGSTTGVGRVLAIRPMQVMGRVSYSWYLWHWPVLLLGAALLDIHNGWIRLALVTTSFVIAAASYYLIETPIRHNYRLLLRPRLAVVIALALMVGGSAAALGWQRNAVAQLADPGPVNAMLAHHDAPFIYGVGCDDWFHSSRVHVCEFGDPHAKHVAVAMGDSVGLQWFPAYKQLFDRPGWKLLVLTKSSCPMVDAPWFYPQLGHEYTVCGKWRSEAIHDVAAMRPDVVVLGSTYTYGFTKAQWINGTRHILQVLAPVSGKIYLMRATPTLPFDGPECVAPRTWLYALLKSPSRCTAPARTTLTNTVFQWLQNAVEPFKNVQTIDMTNAVCPDGTCHAKLHGKFVYRDAMHMTATYAATLAPELAKAMGIQPTPTDTRGHRSTLVVHGVTRP